LDNSIQAVKEHLILTEKDYGSPNMGY
jgi:hypothetical protein